MVVARGKLPSPAEGSGRFLVGYSLLAGGGVLVRSVRAVLQVCRGRIPAG